VLSLQIPPDGARITAVRAGHPGMLLHGAGTVEWIEPPFGPALGLHADDWPQHEIELPAGHGLLLLTDGLFEGYSGRGSERLGEDGLLALARSPRDCPVRRSSTRSLMGPRNAPRRTAGLPMT